MPENTPVNEQLLALEKALRTRLSPVQPSQQFVGSLRQRLEDSTIDPQRKWLAMVLLGIAGGLAVGLVVFLISKSLDKSGEEA
ncbi:MAG: hypothetical protein SVR81_04505 [Chloroflexota bacterium]|nr:hypothetical protein [Chloroflexota bacterium]